MKSLLNKILSVALLTLGIFTFAGCGEEDTPSQTVYGTESTVEFQYGYYGPNKDLGTSDTIRIIWTKNTTLESALYLTSNVDTSSDSYLEDAFGSPHYHYTIDKATEAGVYTVTCSPDVYTGTWARYYCLRDGMFTSEQDQTLDNGFVIEYTGSNRVYDTNPEGTGTYTLGYLTHPNNQ